MAIVEINRMTKLPALIKNACFFGPHGPKAGQSLAKAPSHDKAKAPLASKVEVDSQLR